MQLLSLQGPVEKIKYDSIQDTGRGLSAWGLPTVPTEAWVVLVLAAGCWQSIQFCGEVALSKNRDSDS